MKIAIYTQHLSSGGAEKRASIYSNYFAEKGIDVCLITMYKVSVEYKLNSNVERYCVAENKEEYHKLSKFERLKKLREIIRQLRPEKIISFLPIFTCYAILAIKFKKDLKKIKIIHSVTLYQRKYKPLNRLIDLFCCLFANAICLQCKEQLKCNWLFKKKCFVSYNPIIDNFDSTTHKNFNVLSIISAGRLTKQKNFEFAIKAVAKAHKDIPNIKYDIFGKGPQKDKLAELINKLKAGNYIELHEFSPNILDEYKKHNIILSTSKYEGFPNGLAEGMMTGLVGLSTPCKSGPCEIIENEVNGFLFKKESELINILSKLSLDKDLCIKLSKNAHEICLHKFNHQQILDTYLEQIGKI